MLIAVTCSMTQAAPSEQLEARIDPVIGMPRLGAPRQVTVTLDWQGSDILRGTLQLDLLSPGGSRQARYDYGEIALSRGSQRFDFQLPCWEYTSGFHGEMRLAARLLRDNGGTSDLGVWRMNAPPAMGRAHVICLCEPRVMQSTALMTVARELRLGQFEPKHEDKTWSPGELREVIVRTDPRQIPAAPLALCSYDLVVLSPEGFAALNPSQTEALLTWVKAGGACVIGVGRGLDSHHLLLLDELRKAAAPRSSHGNEPLSSSESSASAAAVTLLQPELGRAVLFEGGMQGWGDMSAARRAEIALFVWSARRAVARACLRDGHWPKEAALKRNQGDERDRYQVYERAMGVQAGRYRNAGGEQALNLSPIHLGSLYSLWQDMDPPDIRIMPFSVVLVLLGTFIILIGPADYVLLGLLKRRWLTWVVFPLSCIVVTLVTARLARHYMGAQGHQHAVVFADVDSAGGVLRTATVEMTMAGSARIAETDLRRTLISPMPKHWIQQPGYVGVGAPASDDDTMVYRGRIPGHYSFSRRLAQWDPRLICTRSFEDDTENQMPEIAWGKISVDMLRRGQWEKLASTLVPDPKAMKAEFLMFLQGENAVFMIPTAARPSGWRQRSASRIIARFVWEATSRPPLGYYALVSQVSPGCSPYLEDLPVHDETDPDAALVACVFRDKDRTLVVRRRYGGGVELGGAVDRTAEQAAPEGRRETQK